MFNFDNILASVQASVNQIASIKTSLDVFNTPAPTPASAPQTQPQAPRGTQPQGNISAQDNMRQPAPQVITPMMMWLGGGLLLLILAIFAFKK